MNTRSLPSPRRRRSFSDGLSTPGAPVSRRRKLRLEPLESRLLLSTNYLVDSLADVVAADGDVTLREALQAANTDAAVNEAPAGTGHDRIEFDASLAGGTITLALGQFEITSDLDLLAEDAPGLTIDAAGKSRVFFVGAAVSDATISGLTITGGRADHGGGIRNEGTLSVVNSTISGNSASWTGGGIYNNGTLTVTNSTISGNTANYCAGILDVGTLFVINSTISGNSADVLYGGIYSLGTLTVRNSIIALNGASDNQQICGSISSESGFNLIGIDPCFVRDPSPGADETWGTDDDDYGDLRLTDLSPAIDMGNDAFLPADLVTDLDGNPRIYDGLRVDIGAYEFQGNPAPGRETPSTVVTTSGDVFDLYDGGISLREAVWYAAPGELVTFGAGLDGAEILLGGSSILVDRSVSVDASGLESLVINGDGNSRVFTVLAEEAELIALTITGGAAEEGAGIYNFGTLTLTGSTISGNVAYEYGGGIVNEGTLSVVNTTISGNSGQESSGGGIENWGMLSVLNSTISGNSAEYGGGICSDGTLSVVNSTISGNSVEDEGGGIINFNTLSVVNSTISGNSAEHEGGGIDNWGGTLSVVNSTISGNSAGMGGGICNMDELSVVNSTIVGNTADADNNGTGDGGGVYTLPTASTTLHNTIVAGNVLGTVDQTPDDLSGDDVQPASSYNLVGDADSSGGLSDGDENGNIVGVEDVSWLAPLGDYGGPTLTHALWPGSPAIDMGDPEFDPDPPLPTDQRGYTRIADGDGDATARIDIGAYELQFLPKPGDTDLDGDVDPSDLAKVVINWDPAGTNPGNHWGKGNFDGDGDVDPADLAKLALNWSPAGYLESGGGSTRGIPSLSAQQPAGTCQPHTEEAAADAVLQQEPDSREASLGKCAWLYDLDQPNMPKRPSKRPGQPKPLADVVLATYES